MFEDGNTDFGPHDPVDHTEDLVIALESLQLFAFLEDPELLDKPFIAQTPPVLVLDDVKQKVHGPFEFIELYEHPGLAKLQRASRFSYHSVLDILEIA